MTSARCLLALTHIRARGTPMLRARRHGYAPLGDAEPVPAPRIRLFRRRSSSRPATDGVFRNVVAHGVADITRREIPREQPPVRALRISAARSSPDLSRAQSYESAQREPAPPPYASPSPGPAPPADSLFVLAARALLVHLLYAVGVLVVWAVYAAAAVRARFAARRGGWARRKIRRALRGR
jgi:hypothetical protein